MIYFYENANWRDYIYLCMCVCVNICAHVYICIHILFKWSSKLDGDFCINLLLNEARLFHSPNTPFSQPYLTSSQEPLYPSGPAQPFLTQGGPFEVEMQRRVLSDTASFPVLTECILFIVISPVASELPREEWQRSGVYRMSVFKVTLCVSHFFLTKKIKIRAPSFGGR